MGGLQHSGQLLQNKLHNQVHALCGGGSRAAVGVLPAGGDLSNLRVMKTRVQLRQGAEARAGPEWGGWAPGSGIRTFKLSGRIRERPDYLAHEGATLVWCRL